MPIHRAELSKAGYLLLTSILVLAGCTTDGPQSGAGHLGLGLADSALAGGAPALARQVSRAVLARDPSNVPALLRRGDAYYQLGDYARAAASYRQARVLQPRDAAPLMGLGRIALATDPAEAGARFSDGLFDPTKQQKYTDAYAKSSPYGLSKCNGLLIASTNTFLLSGTSTVSSAL